MASNLPNPSKDYQTWYSEALSVVKQLLPERLRDFSSLHTPSKTRKTLDPTTYTMSDYLRGISASRRGETSVGSKAAVLIMQQQANIVSGLKTRFTSKLYDIRTLVHADVLDDELSAADELNKKGFHRGAGAIAGVVLEGHLKTVCERGEISVRKTALTISDLNDLLKGAGKIDVATWRFIQHLGDLRNKCDHRKETDPTRGEVNELIEGVRKITKTVL